MAMSLDDFLRHVVADCVEGTVDEAWYDRSAGMRGFVAHASPDQTGAMEAPDMADTDPTPDPTPRPVNAVDPPKDGL